MTTTQTPATQTLITLNHDRLAGYIGPLEYQVLVNKRLRPLAAAEGYEVVECYPTSGPALFTLAR